MAFSTAPGKMLGGLETRDHCALELFAAELIHESGNCSNLYGSRERGSIETDGPEGTSLHFCTPQRDRSS